MSITLDAGAARPGSPDDYLIGKRQAWFAFAMTFALMLFDYIDRQVIVSLFPHIKTNGTSATSSSARWCRSSPSWWPSAASRWRCWPTGSAA